LKIRDVNSIFVEDNNKKESLPLYNTKKEEIIMPMPTPLYEK